MWQRETNRNDRAASEAIGFIIVFGIVIGGIGLVTLYGYPMLLQQQSTSNEQIMEKNMIVLQNDLKSLAYKTVPYSETSLNVGGGALTVYNISYNTTAQSNFQVYDTNNIISPAIQFQTGDLRYESINAGTGISLENGAVVKRLLSESGSTMLANPRWYYDAQTNSAVIYLIGFLSSDVISQSGTGTVRMSLVYNNYSSYTLPTGDTLKTKYVVNNNANYSAAWGSYFTNSLNLVPTGTVGEYAWPAGITNVVVYQYEINIETI